MKNMLSHYWVPHMSKGLRRFSSSTARGRSPILLRTFVGGQAEQMYSAAESLGFSPSEDA